MKAGEILEKLKHHYKDVRQWVYFEELRPGTGYFMPSKGETKNPEQRIDLYVLNCYSSRNFEKIAFEIKVSRQDFLHEINHPEKRLQALELSNYYYFATPKGLVSPEEIPPECGLVEIDKNSHNLSWTIKAPYREAIEPTWRFVASLTRLSKGEFKIKSLKGKIASLQREVDNLKYSIKIRDKIINDRKQANAGI